MEKSITVDGGEGPKMQKGSMEQARIIINETIQETLELQKNLKVFTIADLGYSFGPNTFSFVDSIIQAVKEKGSTQSAPDQAEVQEFLVYFNDVAEKDFNTLFRTLPHDRQYLAAAMPGSLNGRLFPKSSMNLMHSSSALHWLSKVPEQVTKEESTVWNKGRITYALSSNQIVEAFREQFLSDVEAFFKSRLEELTPAGLLAILVPCRVEGTRASGSTNIHIVECLGDALADLAIEGLTSQELVDSFNVPVFIPTASEVKEVVCKHLTIVKDLHLCLYFTINSPEFIQLMQVHLREVLEVSLCNHFGPELIDELFRRYPEKLEKLLKTRVSTHPEKMDKLFVLVLRKDSSYSMVE